MLEPAGARTGRGDHLGRAGRWKPERTRGERARGGGPANTSDGRPSRRCAPPPLRLRRSRGDGAVARVPELLRRPKGPARCDQRPRSSGREAGTNATGRHAHNQAISREEIPVPAEPLPVASAAPVVAFAPSSEAQRRAVGFGAIAIGPTTPGSKSSTVGGRSRAPCRAPGGRQATCAARRAPSRAAAPPEGEVS